MKVKERRFVGGGGRRGDGDGDGGRIREGRGVERRGDEAGRDEGEGEGEGEDGEIRVLCRESRGNCHQNKPSRVGYPPSLVAGAMT